MSRFLSSNQYGFRLLSVGMRHDEPYCTSTYIMSSSLGPGKVTWSTCSLRDYHTFLQRLELVFSKRSLPPTCHMGIESWKFTVYSNRRKNCLRESILREKLPLSSVLKPGQLYDANMQCALMHGNGYIQVAPRQDHYDGICHMMWCGQGSFGRIITSHPALEGTFCGQNKWCQLGRCVPWSGFGATLAPTQAPPTPAPAPQVRKHRRKQVNNRKKSKILTASIDFRWRMRRL